MYLLESPHRGNSNKFTKHVMYKKNSKVSVTDALGGFISSFFYDSKIRFNSKIFGDKQCRYNEGPLYFAMLVKGQDTTCTHLFLDKIISVPSAMYECDIVFGCIDFVPFLGLRHL